MTIGRPVPDRDRRPYGPQDATVATSGLIVAGTVVGLLELPPSEYLLVLNTHCPQALASTGQDVVHRIHYVTSPIV